VLGTGHQVAEKGALPPAITYFILVIPLLLSPTHCSRHRETIPAMVRIGGAIFFTGAITVIPTIWPGHVELLSFFVLFKD
jgi:hypothetical protein